MLEQLLGVRAGGWSSQNVAPRHARAFVAVFLAALVICPLAGWNLWPFSSWELFSRLRTDRQTAWSAIAVDVAGRSSSYRIGSLPHGYEGFRMIAAGFVHRSALSRTAICDTWLREATVHLGPNVRLVRIYRLQWRLTDHRAVQRTLVWTCTTKGARDAA